MRFSELAIRGAFLIDIDPHRDERGFFARTYCAREFKERGLDTTIAQCSTSFNARRGTLRGLHYQAAPHEETKVVRCTAGAIFDVIVDVRPGSVTYAKWLGLELTSANHLMLYIPPGVAHGFQTLKENSEVLYQISVEYAPSFGRGIRWNDPILAIEWPIPDAMTISAKDASFLRMGS